MVGLGETEEDVIATFIDLKRAGCHNLTIGQCLAPSKDRVPVARFISPEGFEKLGEIARSIGFKRVAAGPLVRSSYRADGML